MKITFEIDTDHENLEKAIEIINTFKKEAVLGEGRLKKMEIPVPVEVPAESRKKTIEELKSILKSCPKDSLGRMMYPTSFKKDFMKFYKDYKKDFPKAKDIEITNLIGLSPNTITEWKVGKKMGSVGKPRKSVVAIKKKLKNNRDRDRKIVDYLNDHPYESWEEVGKKFGLSSTRIHGIAKEGRARIMKRDWVKPLSKETLTYKPYEPEEQKPTEQKTMGQVILRFKNSKETPEKTVAGINECIVKGSLTYKDDANKFGFDKRMLPTPEWFDFMTDVAQTVKRMMGVDVILDPTMTGVVFKK